MYGVALGKLGVMQNPDVAVTVKDAWAQNLTLTVQEAPEGSAQGGDSADQPAAKRVRRM